MTLGGPLVIDVVFGSVLGDNDVNLVVAVLLSCSAVVSVEVPVFDRVVSGSDVVGIYVTVVVEVAVVGSVDIVFADEIPRLDVLSLSVIMGASVVGASIGGHVGPSL